MTSRMSAQKPTRSSRAVKKDAAPRAGFSAALAGFLQEQAYVLAHEKAPHIFQHGTLSSVSPQEKIQAMKDELTVIQNLSDDDVPVYIKKQKQKDKKEMQRLQGIQTEYEDFRKIGATYWKNHNVSDFYLDRKVTYELNTRIQSLQSSVTRKAPRGHVDVNARTAADWKANQTQCLQKGIDTAEQMLHLINAAGAVCVYKPVVV